MKHVETKNLWVQEAIKERGIKVLKIGRTQNAADTLASYSTAATMRGHLALINCSLRDFAGQALAG